MKASYRWLRALVPGLDVTPRELAARFTAAGLEVEGMTAYGEASKACLVVAVASVRPHPTKAGLNLVTVERGAGQGPLEVVCGAGNVPGPGGLVVLAPLGAHLPAIGRTIEARPIAGVVSEGMLCSEAELGLTEGGEGILVLPAGTALPGTPLADAIPASEDTIFEIGLTPNRPDGLGHIGLAREAAALLSLPWNPPPPAAPVRAKSGVAIDGLATVRVADPERCPHYGASAVVDVTIGPSPAWVRYRLASLGVRAVSNVVDITNLVMLEYGHPLHAFDLDRVRGAAIEVRRAREGEPLVTLDGVARTLVADDLVIADAQGAVALAGVMGGGDSEIHPGTTRVLFECAYFEPRGVRRSARRHGLHTEASHRFERGVDPGDVADVLAHAASLATDLAGGAAISGAIHVTGAPLAARHVRLRSARIDSMLGVQVPWDEALAILERLGCRVHASVDEVADLSLPTHRPDLSREIDLIEEVARVRGMDAIPTTLPAVRPSRDEGAREALLRRARGAAVALGLSEAVTYAFTSAAQLEGALAPEASVALKNPLSELQAVMRTSVLPGLLEVVAHARRHGERDVRVFTQGATFFARGSGLPEERLALAALLSGERPAHLTKAEPFDAWDAKGLIEGLVQRLTRAPYAVRSLGPDEARPPQLHPRAAGVVEAGVEGARHRLGTFGLLHPDVADHFDLAAAGPVALVELDLDAILTLPQVVPQFVAIPRFPASPRDLALLVRDDVRAGDVVSAVRAAAGELAEDVRLFDRFTGGGVPKGHASLALRVVYRRADRTLTDLEVDTQHAKVVAEVEAQLGATLRRQISERDSRSRSLI